MSTTVSFLRFELFGFRSASINIHVLEHRHRHRDAKPFITFLLLLSWILLSSSSLALTQIKKKQNVVFSDSKIELILLPYKNRMNICDQIIISDTSIRCVEMIKVGCMCAILELNGVEKKEW